MDVALIERMPEAVYLKLQDASLRLVNQLIVADSLEQRRLLRAFRKKINAFALKYPTEPLLISLQLDYARSFQEIVGLLKRGWRLSRAAKNEEMRLEFVQAARKRWVELSGSDLNF